jgi:hypothetical protein
MKSDDVTYTTETAYPRFQWSKFSPDGRSEQVVVRGDNEEQFTHDIDFAKALLPTVAFPDDIGKNTATPPDKAQEEAPVHHNKPMTKGNWGWYCKTKLPDGTWCKYKPEGSV